MSTLETTFSNHSGKLETYSHLIVTDTALHPYGVVRSTYALYNRKIRKEIQEVPLASFPDYAEYAVENKVIYFISLAPERMIRLIHDRETLISRLYTEMRELQQLEILDVHSAQSLIGRLIPFLASMKLGSYIGNGIMWYPENYEAEGESTQPLMDEDYEDYIRRRICTHIKSRPLPMARFLPIPVEDLHQLNELVTTLHPHKDLNNWVAKSHFAPMYRFSSTINEVALRSLMADEFRCVKNNEPVDSNSVFVFTDAQLDAYGFTIPSQLAREHLQLYVGDYFDELDLSRSFITGSAITAAIIRTRRDQQLSREHMIALLYPPILTTMSNEDQELFQKGENIHTWNPRLISMTEGVLSKGESLIPFTVRPGADVDIAVDNTVTDEEYRAIANQHFAVISRYYPYVKLREIMKPKGDWNYSIYTDDPQFLPIFRTVEIYRSSFRNICSHHVGSVRGCYTARWSRAPRTEPNGLKPNDPRAPRTEPNGLEGPHFYLTASAVYTSHAMATPNYHYFAGRKSTPQDVIVKNLQRGIDILDRVLGDDIIADYLRAKEIQLSRFPFYKGKNVPYSIFAAGIEYTFVQEQFRRAREDEAQRQRRQEDQIARDLAAKRQREIDLGTARAARDAREIALIRKQGILVNTIEEAREIQSLHQRGVYVRSMEEAQAYRESMIQNYAPAIDDIDEPTFASILR